MHIYTHTDCVIRSPGAMHWWLWRSNSTAIWMLLFVNTRFNTLSKRHFIYYTRFLNGYFPTMEVGDDAAVSADQLLDRFRHDIRVAPFSLTHKLHKSSTWSAIHAEKTKQTTRAALETLSVHCRLPKIGIQARD